MAVTVFHRVHFAVDSVWVQEEDFGCKFRCIFIVSGLINGGRVTTSAIRLSLVVVCCVNLSQILTAQNAGLAPIPTIEQPMSPPSAQPGSPGITLSIPGTMGNSGLPAGVRWTAGGSTTTLSLNAGSTSTLVITSVPVSLLSASGTASISVVNTGGLAANIEFFPVATSQSPAFAAPADYTVGGAGSTIQSSAVADFNGDGILDLAVGYTLATGGSAVAVLLGAANGTFGTPSSYTVTNSSSIVVGRFNNAGFIDIVAGDTYLTNNGSGVFTATSLPTAGFQPYAIGDFSQNGVLDIAGLMGGNVQILNNDGSATFTVGQSFTGSLTEPGPMIAADFNGDGILDLAVLDLYAGFPAVRVYTGSLTGGFDANGLATGLPAAPSGFTAADFNGDGKQDLAIAYNQTSGEMLILTGNGDGTFTSGFTELFTNNVSGVVSGDFNEDGKLDLALGTYVVLGNGNGTFSTTPINIGGTANVLLAGDFNNDGRIDFGAASGNTLSIVLQQPSSTPAVSLSPGSLNFGSQAVRSSSSQQSVTLTNVGGANLTISAIAITGANLAEFSQTNNCPASLAASAKCTINVTFTPNASGTASASISITDNATGSPQAVPLSGVGTGPGAKLNPTGINFTSQLLGTTSSVQTANLTNTGTATLTITAINITGTNSADFSQTNNCGTSLPANGSCAVNLTFKPVTAGVTSASANLQVIDSAGTQTVPVTGSVQTFVLSTNCTSLTVVPGQTAIYTVSLAPAQGFNQSVTLACGGAPGLAQCTVSPSSVTLDGVTAVQAKVTATTTAPTSGFLQSAAEPSNRLAGLIGFAGMLGLAGLVMLPGNRRAKQSRKLWVVLFCLCIISTMATMSSCGGGGLPPDPPGTAAGTYPLTVTATFQSGSGTAFTQKVSFDLVVQ